MCLKTEYKCFRDASFFLFFLFQKSALKSKHQWLLCLECFKTGPWRLLNQTEMKIVRRKPNLSNPILAFLWRFETLEGYSVFHRRLSTAAHIQIATYCRGYQKKLKRILPSTLRKSYLFPTIQNTWFYGVFMVTPASGMLDFILTWFSGKYRMKVLNTTRWSCFERLFYLISSIWQMGLNSAQHRWAPVA